MSFYHEEVPAIIRLAQVVSITTAAGLAGANFSLSLFAIPAVLTAPTPILLSQWRKIYDTGKVAMPPLSILPTILFGGLCYRARDTKGTFGLYMAAALLSPAIIPFTLTIMAPNVKALIAKTDDNAALAEMKEVTEQDQKNAHALVDRWALLNLGRAGLSAASAIVGLWATLGAVDVVGVESVSFLSGANRMG